VNARDDLAKVIATWGANPRWHEGDKFITPEESLADAILAHLMSDEAVERAAEAAHYAQGFDDYGVANDDEREDAEEIARAVILAALGVSSG